MALFDQYLTPIDGHQPDHTPPAVKINPPASGTAAIYALNALADEADRVANTPEGSRNNDLNIAGFRMGQFIGAGLIDADTVRARLTEAARQAKLPEHEIITVLRDNPTSAINRGMLEPRWPDDPLAGTFTVSEVAAGKLGPATTDPDAGTEAPPVEHTSWWPVPLPEAIRGQDHLAPTHLMRDDGQHLLYPGKVNGLLGESESGKSWVAQTAIQQALANDETVLLLDFEDSPDSVHERMLTLGLDDDQLAGFHYANPDETLGALQQPDWTAILTRGYNLIVLDGVNAGMAVLGMDLMSNVDATRFAARILRPLAGTGACVLTVDHLPKNVDQRGKGGIGAQAKRAMMDGCALLVEVSEPFGRGQSGTLHLTVDKDRPGQIRGIAAEAKRAGQVHIDSVAGAVRIHISGPLRQERLTWQPTEVMGAICRQLTDMGPLNFRQLKQLIHARDDTIRMALTALIGQGYIRPTAGARGGIVNHLARPYDPSDEANDEVNDE